MNVNAVRSSPRDSKVRGTNTNTDASADASAASEVRDFKADMARIRKEVKTNRSRVQTGRDAFLALKAFDLRVPTDLLVLVIFNLFREPYTSEQTQRTIEFHLNFLALKLIETKTVVENDREIRRPRRADFHPLDRAALRALAKKRGYLHLEEKLATPN